MFKNLKTNFQEIHYSRRKPNFLLDSVLAFAEFGYSSIINIKNFLYEIKLLKEQKVDAYVICVGNLTTGGVGKTPIVIELANSFLDKKVAIISRGYGAKISNKNPVVIKDFDGLKFSDGTLCGDEPFQSAKKVNSNVVVITCANRKKAADVAIKQFGIEIIILDDGFSNRKIQKDNTILVIDSKMRFGNNHLLPRGPLRESIKQIKRANEIILVDKGDTEFDEAIEWAKKSFNLPIKVSKMTPNKIYNMLTKQEVAPNKEPAIAFCAIGQPEQFFDFVKDFYEITPVVFEDHHKYTKEDIKKLIQKAQEMNISTFITTQKDETKLIEFVKNENSYSFNVLELKTTISSI